MVKLKTEKEKAYENKDYKLKSEMRNKDLYDIVTNLSIKRLQESDFSYYGTNSSGDIILIGRNDLPENRISISSRDLPYSILIESNKSKSYVANTSSYRILKNTLTRLLNINLIEVE